MNDMNGSDERSGRKRSLDQVESCSQNQGGARKQQQQEEATLSSSVSASASAIHINTQEQENMQAPPKTLTRSSTATSTAATTSTKTMKKLRLEAIFHPKFENEKSDDKAIRNQMIQNVSNNKGYIEVTLKHSGSLLLWSGHQRFYSKNSTDNIFTGVGEILLRQHFARAWGDGNGNGNDDGISKFKECSEFIETNSLTLSFEVVPSVLGHHGDIPNRDYMILIAVASRQSGNGKFYNTADLVSFAQRFRLPHNDSWVFSSQHSTEKLFDVYDTMRETGLASNVVSVLKGAADGGHVKSMYPHDIFQGEILEGIVIRYVPYNDNNSEKNIEGKEQVLAKMKDLCIQSEEVLKIVPPEKQSIYHEHHDVLLRTDLRKVYEDQETNDRSEVSFDERVQNLLKESHEKQKRVITRLNTRRSSHRVQDIDINKMISDLLSSVDIDYETRQIATLIQTLGDLKLPVDYNLLKEEIKLDNGTSAERYLCIIHIHHDTSFQKYGNAIKMKEGAMPLYRGFSIELIPEGQVHLYRDRATHSIDGSVEKALKMVRLESNNSIDIAKPIEEEKLMLKMKFLPYMVRTFICRNGLAIFKKSGITGFEQYALSQLNRWNISQEGIEKWMPFFQGWALYCNTPPTVSTSGKRLPALNSANYLHHYNEFSALYENGQFQSAISSDQPTFRGLVVLINARKENLDSLANKMSIGLGCHRVVRDINAISEVDMIGSMQRNRGGILCVANITDGVKNVRLFAKKFKNAIYIVMVGCSQNEIEASFVHSESVGSNRKEVLRTIGISNAWRKCKCNFVAEIPMNATSEVGMTGEEDYVASVMKKLKESSDSFQTDTRPGMFVFFPAIPGSGKSSLCHNLTTDALGIKSRKLIVREGDKTKGKFYPTIEKDILDSPSSVFVADKNVPPASWSSVSNICSNYRSMAVAVLPSDTEDYRIEISHNDSTQVSRSCVFPFQLHYLAVCMYRVLQRAPGSHNGKLDSATDLACMVVVKFYCLYRNMSNSKVSENIHKMGKSRNAILRVPFFREGQLPDLPMNLKQVLDEAVNLQVLNDLNMLAVNDETMKQMEEKLRSHLAEHSNFLVGLTAAEDYSRQSFLDQFSNKIASLGDVYEGARENALRVNSQQSKSKKIMDMRQVKIASLDVSQTDVHRIMNELAKEYFSVEEFLQMRTSDYINDDDAKRSARFIQATHCTFAHCSGLSQEEMHSTFDHFIGMQLEICVTSLLFNDLIAALEVSIPLTVSDDSHTSNPQPCNKFPHITVWCGQNIQAWQSNLLPKQVKANQAIKVELKKPISLRGKFSFWYEE